VQSIMCDNNNSIEYDNVLEIEQDRWSFEEWTNTDLCVTPIFDDVIEWNDQISSTSDSSASELENDTSGNEYMKRLLLSADLHILLPQQVLSAHNSEH
jgi:hypothetical protein